MIYLAGPYSHQDRMVMEDRAWRLTIAAARIMRAGRTVYSPITHGHAVQRHLPEELRKDHRFWLRHDMEFLTRATELWVLTLEGWQESRGVQWEIATAKALGIPVKEIAEGEI